MEDQYLADANQLQRSIDTGTVEIREARELTKRRPTPDRAVDVVFELRRRQGVAGRRTDLVQSVIAIPYGDRDRACALRLVFGLRARLVRAVVVAMRAFP